MDADSNKSDAPSRKYLIITPCRDEAKYAHRTLDAILNQSVKPTTWVIVDDGSSDDTPRILDEYAAKAPFIKIVRRSDRGERRLGSGVIEAFYTGLGSVNIDEYDYVCKMDLDIEIAPDYFERIIQRMEVDPRIGTCSGKPYFRDAANRLISEACGDEASVGMIKFYRVPCFKQIGGFVRELMWDGIDCHRCRMLGWVAVSWDDPDIRFEHLRPMGSSHRSIWNGRMRHGIGQYYMGTSPVYMIASALYRMTRPPVMVGGIAMLWGYFKAMWNHHTRYADESFRHFLRDYQWRCLTKGKERATEELNERQQTIWNPRKAA